MLVSLLLWSYFATSLALYTHEVIELLDGYVGSLRKNDTVATCVNGVPKSKKPLSELNLQFIDGLVGQRNWTITSLVSTERREATMILSRYALLLTSEGDFVETGVFLGGTSALMIKTLLEFDPCSRKFYAFDSFEGLPPPTIEDKKGESRVGEAGNYAATQEIYEGNLKKMGVWDDKIIRVAKGWFKTTCPMSPVEKISFLRLDGDLYASTWDAISALYHKVVPGGLIYVDDYGSYNGCRQAIDKFRSVHKIWEPLHLIREKSGVGQMTFEAVWWVKSAHHQHHEM